MPCFHPLTAYKSPNYFECDRYGKQISFSRPNDRWQEIQLPCGQCIGCRLKRSKEWAIRCMHELRDHQESCFLTLTYRPEDLPENGSLDPDVFVKFMKRLRKHIEPQKIRFFQCGEYGSNYGRPHHHAIIFGWRPKDLKFFKMTNGQKLWISQELEDIWQHGYCVVGDVTFDSCAYVARYILKKQTGEDSELYYSSMGKHPEYVTMSRMPGIGKNFFETHKGDIFSNDFVLDNKHFRLKPPAYYDKLYHSEVVDSGRSDLWRDLKDKRVENVRFFSDEDLKRMRDHKEYSLKKLHRQYEKFGELKND